MPKTVKVTIRITQELKDMLTRQAVNESRSITSYLEWLIKRDARRQRDSRKPDVADE